MSTDIKQKSFSEVIGGQTPVLVDFYADWCAPCRMMPPILKELKKRMGDQINIIKIDTEKNPAVAIKYQVRSIPTLILFKNGEVLWQQAGVMQAPQLESVIKQKLDAYEPA
jgi:thioredoxin 1